MSLRPHLTAAALAAATALAACGGNKTPQPTGGTRAPVCARSSAITPGATVAVGRGAQDLELAGGRLWIANPRAGSLTEIDAATGKGSGKGPVRLGGAPVSVAAGFARLWVADRDRDRIEIVDPRTRRIRTGATIDTPVRVAMGINEPFALSLDDGTLQRLDPRTGGAITNEVGVPARAPVDMARLGPDIWVLGSADRGVVPFELRHASFVRSGLRVGNGAAAGLTTGQGALWVATPGDDAVVRVDPVRAQGFGLVGPRGFAPTRVAVDDCAVWIGNARGEVARLDPATGKPLGARVKIGTSIGDMVVAGDGIWVSDPAGGTVVRVTPRGPS